MTHCDKLGPVFKTGVVLLQNLHKHKTRMWSADEELYCQIPRRRLRRAANLEQVGALPWPQTTDVLDQALSVRVGDGPVHVHSNLIDSVDEFTVKSREQILLHHMFLKEKGVWFQKYKLLNHVSIK